MLQQSQFSVITVFEMSYCGGIKVRRWIGLGDAGLGVRRLNRSDYRSQNYKFGRAECFAR
jgi:hypothetical protein